MGASILLVEDEPFLLPLLQRGLLRAGHQVAACSNAESASELFHAGPRPALLIADVTLPGRSGIDLAGELLAADPQLACILTSGYPVDIALLPAIVQPRIRVLQKPFMIEALLQMVAAALNTGSSS